MYSSLFIFLTQFYFTPRKFNWRTCSKSGRCLLLQWKLCFGGRLLPRLIIDQVEWGYVRQTFGLQQRNECDGWPSRNLREALSKWLGASQPTCSRNLLRPGLVPTQPKTLGSNQQKYWRVIRHFVANWWANQSIKTCQWCRGWSRLTRHIHYSGDSERDGAATQHTIRLASPSKHTHRPHRIPPTLLDIDGARPLAGKGI